MLSGTAYAEIGEAKKQLTKLKLILSKITNNNSINSQLPLLKYFLVITLKSDYEVKIVVFAIQNCLPKGLDLQCADLKKLRISSSGPSKLN
jgi:hypothetical protein